MDYDGTIYLKGGPAVLTPVDIENKEFGKSFRGYDIDEVEEFLQVLVADYEKLYRENASLKEKNAMLQETIGNYRGMEETMQNAIIAAQRTAEDIKRNAYHRAENITREAQTRANESIASADKTIQELENSYLALQGEVDAYRARMRSLLETNLKLLDDMPRVEIKTIERVKFDPVTIEAVEHTAPIPNVENHAEEETENTATFDFGSMIQQTESESTPVKKTEFVSAVSDQRVPLSEKIPVAQGTRGTHINPLVEQLMRENKKPQAEQIAEERSAENGTESNDFATQADFSVKKETVSAGEFTEEPQEFYLRADKKKKHGKHDKSSESSGNYYDVFSDDTL